MNENEYLTFPFEVGNIKQIKLRKICHGNLVTLTDDGQIVKKLIISGMTPSKIAGTCDKFGVDFEDQIMSITVGSDQLKMGKDKLLQSILILST